MLGFNHSKKLNQRAGGQVRGFEQTCREGVGVAFARKARRGRPRRGAKAVTASDVGEFVGHDRCQEAFVFQPTIQPDGHEDATIRKGERFHPSGSEKDELSPRSPAQGLIGGAKEMDGHRGPPLSVVVDDHAAESLHQVGDGALSGQAVGCGW